MKIRIFSDPGELFRAGAALVIETVRNRPHPKLGLATGMSPVGIYTELVESFRLGKVSFRNVTSVNLDEYAGLSKDHPESFAAFMHNRLFSHIDLPFSQIHIPDGIAADPLLECQRYDRLLDSIGHLDLQLLGVGLNGHIGFNEPGPLEARTHIVRLTDETRQVNSSSFRSSQDVPTHAITMGVRDILQARRILFVALGASKAEVVHRSLTGPLTTECPASLLQLHHDVHVLLDQEAGAHFR